MPASAATSGRRRRRRTGSRWRCSARRPRCCWPSRRREAPVAAEILKLRGLRWKILVAAALVGVAVLSGGGYALHTFALGHVAYYTGDTPRDLNCVSCHFEARGGTLTDRIL